MRNVKMFVVVYHPYPGEKNRRCDLCGVNQAQAQVQAYFSFFLCRSCWHRLLQSLKYLEREYVADPERPHAQRPKEEAPHAGGVEAKFDPLASKHPPSASGRRRFVHHEADRRVLDRILEAAEATNAGDEGEI